MVHKRSLYFKVTISKMTMTYLILFPTDYIENDVKFLLFHKTLPLFGMTFNSKFYFKLTISIIELEIIYFTISILIIMLQITLFYFRLTVLIIIIMQQHFISQWPFHESLIAQFNCQFKLTIFQVNFHLVMLFLRPY